MGLRVIIDDGLPVVIDDNGQRVPGASINRVDFPTQKISGPGGDTWEISGSGQVEVTIDGKRAILPLGS